MSESGSSPTSVEDLSAEAVVQNLGAVALQGVDGSSSQDALKRHIGKRGRTLAAAATAAAEERKPSALPSIVKLNVGGYKFTSSRATLCRVPGTHLECMFSGRHANPTDVDPDDGSYFIDRDGTHFRHVLNFLRVGAVVSLPESATARDELAAEADFYGLDDLVKAIRQPRVDIVSYLSPETQRIREEEAELRRAFANKAAQGYDIHRGLISLFASPEESSLVDSKWTAPLLYERPGIEASDMLCMASLRGRSMKRGSATCETLKTFRTTFNSHHPNILNRLETILREQPVVIAGGSVLQALTHADVGEGSQGGETRTKGWWKGESDVDLFVYGVNPDEATQIVSLIFNAVALDNESWGIVRSRGVIDIHQFVDMQLVQKVQIILRIYDSPIEILVGFDADCCCCAYDGRDVWLSKRCVTSLMSGINVLNPIHAWPNKASYEMRLAKYAYRGFPVLVPGMDKSRTDFERIQQTDIGSLKGLARLLKISQEMESASSALRRTGYSFDPPTGFHTTLDETGHILALRKEDKVCRDDAEIVVNGGGWYDGIGPYNVLVPKIYNREHMWRWNREVTEPVGLMWWSHFLDFPLTRSSRDEAWAELVECENPPEGVPARLQDAWDTEKRSREYLNGKMDEWDLDNLYYSHAYRA